MLHPTSRSQRFAFNPILIGGLILYVCAFAILLQRKGFDASGAVVVLIVFGIVFPLLAWASTRRAIPLSISVKPNSEELAEIGKLIDAGKIKVIVSQTFPLADAIKAQQQVATGHTRGKIVLKVADEPR